MLWFDKYITRFRPVHKTAKSDYYLRLVCLSACPSTRKNLTPTGQIFVKFDLSIFENLSRKLKVYLNLTRITGTWHEDKYTFLIISCSVLFRIKNISDETCRENQSTHFTFSNFSFENRAICEIIWKNVIVPARPQVIVWLIRIACWIPKATNEPSDYVILIAFPLQQLLHERASVLCYRLRTLPVLCDAELSVSGIV
jgi:hypothetical protein